MSDIGEVAERIFAAEVRVFAEKFVSRVLAEVRDSKPPCAGGERPPWTAAIKRVLREMGTSEGYAAYDWEPLLDFVWWSMKDGEEKMVLAVESELDEDVVGQIAQDFQKLPSFKCQQKLLVFSADPDETRLMAESYLLRFMQHYAGEAYVLIGFTDSGPRCYLYTVPDDGKQDKVKFTELSMRTARP